MVSVLLIVKSNFTVEGFLIVLMYKGNILNFINFVINITEILKEGELSALRVFEVIEDKVFEKETFGNKVVENINGNIEFKNVDFKYSKEDKKLLFKNLNFKVKENSVVAIVGKSGQGKTTILNLINKMYPIEEKRNSGIFIDGNNINDLTKESLRSNITVVPQNPYIFNLTIKENLQIVKKEATMEEIVDVCKKAQIYDFIISKEKGFDSIVGENGIVLSGGQKQRLAIARALLKNSKIILLDEATSSLDNESQAKIKKVIKTLSKTHTILVVAHRLSTVVDCDKILNLENNKIVNEGTHEYLMKNVEGYRQLYMEEEQK
jgi:ATP-binding cassette subfamily B protein